ncbi:binding-protein-dependent transport system inner membrane protein [Nitratireductor indicus C115]|uniref:Binding-protein-dependent transport system inner membrane protein n=1 Tax=Nitratireductor indicus C115 TaxID=1231190 RepID=K2NTX3_9HYPH|nr:iron ABC transporter permease [Nitratireductor indicus]EKF41279.1 binding-protein-dependent transport system inner membrane protein [Nitratireductor indicus C115]SFQ65416.1 iron(III) transport system permease protein [Nitratireductor indicus]
MSGTARSQLRLLARDPVLLVLLTVIALSIAVFVVYPLVKVFMASLHVNDVWTLDGYRELAERRLYRNALVNSLSVAALVGIISVAIGYVAAFVLTRLEVPGKTLLHYITILPIVSPPFVSAVSILFLFGFNGLVTRQLLGLNDFSIYGFHGVVISQVFTFAPIAYLSLRGVLASLSPTLEDAALNIGATRWQTFWKVTFPLSLPGIASAFLVVFIESMADFGNPLVLAGAAFPMLAPQAYLEITGSFNLSRGATLAIVLLIPSMTAFAIQRYYLAKRQYITVTGKPTASTSKIVSNPMKWLLYGIVSFFAVLVTAFYAVIIVGAFTQVWGFNYTPTLAHFRYVFDVGLDSVKDTLIVAIVSTPISGILGMLVAFLVVRRVFPGRTALEFGSILSFAVPGTVVGIGYILAFNAPPIILTGTLAILVLCFVFRYVPVGIQSGIAVLRQIDPSIEEAAQNLGANGLTTFRKVTLPLIAPAFFSGLVYAFVRAMTAISAAIFLVSANWNLMTVQILNQVGSGRLGVSAAFSVVVIVIVLIAIGIISFLINRWTRHTSMVRFQ